MILEDDVYGFSIMTPAEMSLSLDTLMLEDEVFYVFYAGSYVDEQDTIYYRIDVWENPMEKHDSMMTSADEMLDSTLLAVKDRLNGSPLYEESLSRNGWPGRLVRYDLGEIRRQSKVLLIRRLNRYYLLTVVASPDSIRHKGVNRFIHSFKLYE